jgi:hypothetical protein
VRQDSLGVCGLDLLSVTLVVDLQQRVVALVGRAANGGAHKDSARAIHDVAHGPPGAKIFCISMKDAPFWP